MNLKSSDTAGADRSEANFFEVYGHFQPIEKLQEILGGFIYQGKLYATLTLSGQPPKRRRPWFDSSKPNHLRIFAENFYRVFECFHPDIKYLVIGYTDFSKFRAEISADRKTIIDGGALNKSAPFRKQDLENIARASEEHSVQILLYPHKLTPRHVLELGLATKGGDKGKKKEKFIYKDDLDSHQADAKCHALKPTMPETGKVELRPWSQKKIKGKSDAKKKFLLMCTYLIKDGNDWSNMQKAVSYDFEEDTRMKFMKAWLQQNWHRLPLNSRMIFCKATPETFDWSRINKPYLAFLAPFIDDNGNIRNQEFDVDPTTNAITLRTF